MKTIDNQMIELTPELNGVINRIHYREILEDIPFREEDLSKNETKLGEFRGEGSYASVYTSPNGKVAKIFELESKDPKLYTPFKDIQKEFIKGKLAKVRKVYVPEFYEICETEINGKPYTTILMEDLGSKTFGKKGFNYNDYKTIIRPQDQKELNQLNIYSGDLHWKTAIEKDNQRYLVDLASWTFWGVDFSEMEIPIRELEEI